MLWLTGVFGAMLVGSVAFLDLAPAGDEEDDTHLDDFLDEHGPYLPPRGVSLPDGEADGGDPQVESKNS